MVFLGSAALKAPAASLASQCQYMEISKTSLRITRSSTLVTERKNKPLVSCVGAALVIQQDLKSHQSTETGILLERDVDSL